MSDVFNGIREMVNCELMKMTQKGELDKAMLENLDKLVDILKDLDEIENGGYSQRNYNYGYDNGNSYRYMPTRNYSRHGNNSTVDHLYKAMDQAQSEAERQAIQMAIDKIMNS